jgi:hypothetical protein
MSLSLYEITVPVIIAGLGNTPKFLDRARAYADEKSIAHVQLLNARLADDMMSLVEQVQRASDTAKYAAVRVGRVDNVAMPDRETTFDDLQARISATVSFLGAVPPTAFERQAEPSWSFSSLVDSGFSQVVAIYWTSRFRTSSSTSLRRTTCFVTWMCRSANGTFSVGAERGLAGEVVNALEQPDLFVNELRSVFGPTAVPEIHR